MKYAIGFVIGVVVTSLYFMWQNKKQQSVADATPTTELPTGELLSNDFQDFYQRFHEDSLFQVSHITFPLEGLPAGADSLTFATGNFRWTEDRWRMQHPISTTSGEFTKDYIALSDELIIEKITHESGQFGIQRRFSKIGDEWHLIYYAGLNRVAPQQTEQE